MIRDALAHACIVCYCMLCMSEPICYYTPLAALSLTSRWQIANCTHYSFSELHYTFWEPTCRDFNFINSGLRDAEEQKYLIKSSKCSKISAFYFYCLVYVHPYIQEDLYKCYVNTSWKSRVLHLPKSSLYSTWMLYYEEAYGIGYTVRMTAQIHKIPWSVIHSVTTFANIRNICHVSDIRYHLLYSLYLLHSHDYSVHCTHMTKPTKSFT